ncbi:MAG: NADH-quinone oxidoreductase subunit N [Bdellovibrionaceae bacterium]|nr:NADH-quinone oxidoreductase subunit N [Bdellovibrio sp.]
MNISMADILLISPMIALFLFSLIPLTIKVLRGNVEQSPTATIVEALIGLFLTAGLLIVFGGSGKTAFNGQLVFDGLTQWMGLIAVVSAGFSMILMYENPATRGKQFSELIFLAMNSILGMLILVSAVDLITIFIGLELMSLSLYLMIAMSHEQKISKEAAIKYFVLGSFASAIFLYGVSFVFGSAGTINILDLMENASTLIKTSKVFLFGVSFISLGFCFKVSIAPFHAWTPDVYQGAPTPVTSFMATAVKTVSFAAFLRVLAMKPLIGSDNLFLVLQWFAVLTMTIGNVAALVQTNLKRTIAYSSISHSGYILVGLITAGISQNSVFAASSVVFYLLAYSLMTFGAFAIVSLIEKNENSVVQTDDLAGFAKNQPMLALCLTIFLLSLAGIPPALGFFGKFYLFSAAVSEGLLWLALWGVLNSAIGVYYYLRPIVVMYMREGDCDISDDRRFGTTVAIVTAALLIVVLGIGSGPLFEMIERSLM